MKICKIKKLNNEAIIPTRGSAEAAGYDLYACISEAVTIEPHTTVKIGTGLAITPPEGTFGAIFARSGIATKKGLRPANCVGCCDIDYTGEYIVALHNDTDTVQTIEPKERIAQLVFLPYVIPEEMKEVEELDETVRGSGGFGSTGETIMVCAPNLKDLVGDNMAQQIIDYVKERKKVIILGSVGAGKSTLLYSILKELRKLDIEYMEELAWPQDFVKAKEKLEKSEYFITTAYGSSLEEYNKKFKHEVNAETCFNGALHCERIQDVRNVKIL